MVHPLASVVYVDCPAFTIAFGSAVGMVNYVQIFVLKRTKDRRELSQMASIKGIANDLQDIAKSSLQKKE